MYVLCIPGWVAPAISEVSSVAGSHKTCVLFYIADADGWQRTVVVMSLRHQSTVQICLVIVAALGAVVSGVNSHQY